MNKELQTTYVEKDKLDRKLTDIEVSNVAKRFVLGLTPVDNRIVCRIKRDENLDFIGTAKKIITQDDEGNMVYVKDVDLYCSRYRLLTIKNDSGELVANSKWFLIDSQDYSWFKGDFTKVCTTIDIKRKLLGRIELTFGVYWSNEDQRPPSDSFLLALGMTSSAQYANRYMAYYIEKNTSIVEKMNTFRESVCPTAFDDLCVFGNLHKEVHQECAPLI